MNRISENSASCQQPISYENFLADPFERKFIDYATFQAYSFKKQSVKEWDQRRSGIAFESFARDVALNAIELTKTDLLKPDSPFRNENADSFKYFFWYRIMKVFHAKLDEIRYSPDMVPFDEGMFKTAGMDADLGGPEAGMSSEGSSIYYSGSREKEQILQDSYDEKMRQVEKIRNIVSSLSPDHQRLFNLKFGFSLTEEDYRKMDEIRRRGHIREPYTVMASEEMGIPEGIARKRLHDMLAFLKRELTRDGTMDAYRSLTAIPGLTEWKVEPKSSYEEIDIDQLSESYCLELCVELFY